MTTKQQLREALELYANADYEGTGFWDGISTPGILRDKGRVAKEALALPSQRPDDEGVDDIQLLYLREDIAERFNQMPHPYEIADAVMAIVRPYLRAKPDAGLIENLEALECEEDNHVQFSLGFNCFKTRALRIAHQHTCAGADYELITSEQMDANNNDLLSHVCLAYIAASASCSVDTKAMQIALAEYDRLRSAGAGKGVVDASVIEVLGLSVQEISRLKSWFDNKSSKSMSDFWKEAFDAGVKAALAQAKMSNAETTKD